MKFQQKQTGQVQLFNLIFSQSWEDPRSDHLALGDVEGKTIFSITSGCDNTLEFLLQSPRLIHAVDLNPTQNFLLDLKKTAISRLSYPDFLALMGVGQANDRWSIYQSIRSEMGREARIFWDDQPRAIRNGLIYSGKFERFLRYVRLLLGFLQGRKNIRELFEQREAIQQRQFFDEVWDNWRIRMLFSLAFHPRIYPRGALKADYFHFDDGSTSFAESFYRRFRHALREIPVEGNYFLSMYLQGKYHSGLELPLYLQEQHFETLKGRLDRIRPFTGSAIEFLKQAPSGSIDGFSLSNICELMGEGDTELLFREVVRTASPDAGICFRNLIVPREAPSALIWKDENLSRKLLNQDRSFIYSKVAAYRVLK